MLKCRKKEFYQKSTNNKNLKECCEKLRGLISFILKCGKLLTIEGKLKIKI